MLSHTSRCKIKRYIYLYCLPKMASHYYCPPKMPSLTKNGITLSSTNKCITLMSTNNDITLLTCNNGVTLLTANNGILLLSTNHGVTIWLPIMASCYCLPIIPSHYCLPIMASHYYCLEIMASHYWLPIKASHGQKSWSLFSWSTAPLNINLDWFHFRVWLVAHPPPQIGVAGASNFFEAVIKLLQKLEANPGYLFHLISIFTSLQMMQFCIINKRLKSTVYLRVSKRSKVSIWIRGVVLRCRSDL